MIDEIKKGWEAVMARWKYKAPLKEGQTGYFKYGWTMVFLERVKKVDKNEVSLLSKLSQRQNGLVDM